MLNEIDILEASPSQVDEVLSLWLEAAHWMLDNGIDQWRPEYFNRETVLAYFHNRQIFLVKMNDEIVGSFALQWSDPSVWGDLHNEESGYLHRFVVRRTQAGRNIGQYMLKWIEEYVKTQNKRYVRLDCMATNEALNGYYRKQNFTYRGTFQLQSGEISWRGSLYEKEV
ncbi:GNAT family N-acetyltransferase [Paenibacillus alba]|uniref:GNAT family N-acetyltransferase n=1 Tax=Paenibacillus alba TaxID=1197127 RepID=UPI001565A406|nr:GNAT family N-acetyltransferase [Paenibacillus alba]NQX70235.1 GNAT family N-acetyltransferase [Paenibacillus alba]